MAQRPTEEPTPRRLQRARREGDHPVSAALVSAAGLAGGALLLPLAAEAVAREASELLQLALTGRAEGLVASLPARVMRLSAPVIGVSALCALAAGLWQTGAVVSFQPLRWDFGRLSPWSSPGRLGSTSRVLGALAMLATLTAITWVAFEVLTESGPSIAHSIGSARAAMDLAFALSQRLALLAALGLLGWAVVDAMIVRVSWRNRLRMTRDEVKRERRDTEGDPAVKLARHRAHQELLVSAKLQRVSQATLVVGGPLLATALHYDAEQSPTPRVIVQAVGARAQALVSLAVEHRIPVCADPLLARRLASIPVEEEIPPGLYGSVAEAMQSTPADRSSNAEA